MARIPFLKPRKRKQTLFHKTKELPMITATVIADSISPDGTRVTTMELQYPRYIHSEFMTHRCLVGETELHFDLPKGMKNSTYRLYKMTINDFFERWSNGGAVRKPSRYIKRDLSKVEPGEVYKAKELATLVGYTSASPIRNACREGKLIYQNVSKSKTEDFLIKGEDYLVIANKPVIHKQDMKSRLGNMRIRAYDEATKQVIHTNITDIWLVGEKPTYTLTTDDGSITGTTDHPILTQRGWVELGKITEEDLVMIVSNKQSETSDEAIHKKINGKWRSVWQNQQRERLKTLQSDCCSKCNKQTELEIHHIIPVYTDPTKCFDEDNIVAICKDCHKQEHSSQDWHKGNSLGASMSKVLAITATGKAEKVYDLSVSDSNHNFVANGIVVHNCFNRNASSSRAIPTMRFIEQVRKQPVVPIHWGQNQKGMQAEEEISPSDQKVALTYWNAAASSAAIYAEELHRLRVHKQVVNRILEPFLHIKTVVTSTDWNNFFGLRIHKDAQPEILDLAAKMKTAMALSKTTKLAVGQWHLPYITAKDAVNAINFLKYGRVTRDEPNDTEVHGLLVKVSSARCARASYNNFEGKPSTIEEDLKLFAQLVEDEPVHASPTEHPCTPMEFAYENRPTYWEKGVTHMDRAGRLYSGPTRGWIQFRKLIPNETIA